MNYTGITAIEGTIARELADALAAKWQRAGEPYGYPDKERSLAFSCVKDYAVNGDKAMDWIIERLEHGSDATKTQVLQGAIFALSASFASWREHEPLPVEAEQKLLTAIVKVFQKDPQGSFITKAYEQDAGIHCLLHDFSSYLVKRTKSKRPQLSTEVTSLLPTLLAISLETVRQHGTQNLFGGNCPFYKFTTSITHAAGLTGAAREVVCWQDAVGYDGSSEVLSVYADRIDEIVALARRAKTVGSSLSGTNLYDAAGLARRHKSRRPKGNDNGNTSGSSPKVA